MAFSVPSVPEFVNRTFSTDGTLSQRACANRTCDSCGVL